MQQQQTTPEEEEEEGIKARERKEKNKEGDRERLFVLVSRVAMEELGTEYTTIRRK